MFAHLNPHSSDLGDICVLYPPFLHQLTMQSSLFQPGRPVIFTRSTSERVDATMKGPSEKGDLFAVLEYMKGGQVVTHPCAPLTKIEFFIRSPSPSPEPEVHSYHAFSRVYVGSCMCHAQATPL